VDLVLVVGTPQPDLRVPPEALVLHIQPAGSPSIAGSTTNVVDGPVAGFGSWAARAVGQVSEPILVPGVIGIDFADIPPFPRESGELRFEFGRSPSGILEARETVVTRARPWLTRATSLLVRITGGPDTTLEDVNTLCMTIAETAHADVCIAFAATVSEEENMVGVMGG
jgi:cell division protein FtsZ